MIRMLLLVAVLSSVAASAAAEEVVVTRGDDGPGSGTLRWAIELANQSPGRDGIAIDASIRLIQPTSPLPPITDAVTLAARDRTTIDGSFSPALVALAVHGDGSVIVRLSLTNWLGNGLEISGSRNTVRDVWAGASAKDAPGPIGGDGIIVRGNDNELTDLIAVSSRNGIVVSGSRNRISYGGIGLFYLRDRFPFPGDSVFFGPDGPLLMPNRAAGVHLTSTAAENLLGSENPPCYGCLPESGGRTVILGNMTDGIRIDGPRNRVIYTTVGVSQCGEQDEGNGGHGIVVNGPGAILQSNDTSGNRGAGARIALDTSVIDHAGSGNVGLLIDGGPPGVTPNDVPDDDGLLNAPALDRALIDLWALTYGGSLTADPETDYEIELILFPPTSCPSAEAIPIDAFRVRTDGSGYAAFERVILMFYSADRLAVRARRVDGGGSSELSEAIVAAENTNASADLRVSGMVDRTETTPGQTVNYAVTVTNAGPSAVAIGSVVVNAPGSDAPRTGARLCQAICSGRPDCAAWVCQLDPLGPGQSMSIEHSYRVTDPVGTSLQYAAQVGVSVLPVPDPDLTNNATETFVRVVAGSRRRPR